jgi:ATP-binding cassette subfamily B protein
MGGPGSLWRDLARRIRPYRGRVAIGLVALVATNALQQTIPYLLRGALDALQAIDVEGVRGYAMGAAALALAGVLTRVYSRTAIFYVGRDIEFDLRNDLLAKLHKLGPSFFRRMPTGETMSRAINDLTQVRLMVGFGSLNVVNSVLAYALALGFMLSMSVELTLWALAPYPLLLLTTRWLGRMMFVHSTSAQEALGELSARVQETLSGIRLVRAFAVELEQRARFEAANQNALKRNMVLVTLRGLMWPLLMGVGSLGTLLVLWRGTSMMQHGELSAGEMLAFLAYGESLRWPTMGLGYVLAVVQRGRASYDRIREILDADPDVREPAHPRVPSGAGALSVRDLSYAYDGHPVLDRVSFELPAGGSLAIVGRTGSGKSTLGMLLPRLLPTPPGTVFLDGEDVSECALGPLRRAVGYAQQEPFLFSASVARNVGYRFDDVSTPEAQARIRESTRDASVLEEIEGLPDGFATLVGERGVQLSGGQKQRVALARALLNEPQVLVMDDPLSAVDARTEAAILEALERAGQGRTMILITNRVAAAAACDQVLVLDAGRVVERGDHARLLEAGGLYARLADRQRLERELAAL